MCNWWMAFWDSWNAHTCDQAHFMVQLLKPLFKVLSPILRALYWRSEWRRFGSELHLGDFIRCSHKSESCLPLIQYVCSLALIWMHMRWAPFQARRSSRWSLRAISLPLTPRPFGVISGDAAFAVCTAYSDRHRSPSVHGFRTLIKVKINQKRIRWNAGPMHR